MISSQRLGLVLVCLSFWLAATPARASGPNQLPNGGFEDPSANPDTPYGWSRAAFAPGASLTWEADVREREYGAFALPTQPRTTLRGPRP